jgi:Flp pilus assembly protein TadG
MNLRKDERGQAMVIFLSTFGLLVVLGMAALVLDVGSWYRTKRQLQSTADAAALAGAQELPQSSTLAKSTAQTYADKNGGNVLGANIVVSQTVLPDDSISVKAEKNESGFFSSVFGFNNAPISARAKARVGPPVQVRYVAPMVVYCGHSLIQNCDSDHTPTFNQQTTLPFSKEGAPGAFGMLNLDGGNGTPGTSDEANWILHGFDKYLGLGKYRSDPGAKFESSNIDGALDDRIGTVLLFPVFKTLDQQGQNADYVIIGWIGFHLDSYSVQGNTATLKGYFTEYIAQGILSQSGGGGSGGSPPSSTWGVKSIQLIE